MYRYAIIFCILALACKPTRNPNSKKFIDHSYCIKLKADKKTYDYSCAIGFTFPKVLPFTDIEGNVHQTFDNSILNLIHLAKTDDPKCQEESAFINELQNSLKDCVHIYSFYPENKSTVEQFKSKYQLNYNFISDGITLIQDSTDHMPFNYPCSILLNKQNQVIGIYNEINANNYHIVHNLIESTCNF